MYKIIYRGEYDGIAVGRVERSQDFTAKLGFYHNEYQIQYIFRGERYFFSDGTCYRMSPGTITFIDKARIAKTNIIGGKYHDRLLIELKESALEPLCAALGMDLKGFYETHHGVYQVGENPVVQETIAEIERIAALADEDLTGARIKLQVLRIMIEHCAWENTRIGKFDESGVQSHINKQKRVHQVADYIAANYDSIASVSDLAAHFYMSKAYLCRIFKEVTNFTISEYINLYRISASREYLEDEKYSMTEIANRLGYDSLTYFERVFKRQMTVTPLQYRKSLLKYK